MKNYIFKILLLFMAFCAAPCKAQRFEIINPNGTVYKSMQVNDYVALATTNGLHVRGQLAQIKQDTLLIATRQEAVFVPLNAITKAKQISYFSYGPSRWIIPLSVVIPTVVLATSERYKKRTFAGDLLFQTVTVLPTTLVAFAAVYSPRFKKQKLGFMFKTELVDTI